MGKANKFTFAPLALLKNTTARYPQAWEQMDMFHKENGSDLGSWPQWCYAPMAAAIAVATNGVLVSDPEQFLPYMGSAQVIDALAPWRLSKEVFVMDSEMESLLYEQQDDLDLQPDILLQLPYPCFYVQVSSLFYGAAKVDEFFVHLEYDINTKEQELRLLYLFEDGSTAGYPVHIDMETLRDSMLRFIQQAHNNVAPGSQLRKHLLLDDRGFDSLENVIKKSLQIVLYLCAENAEIQKDPEQATVMKRSGIIRDKYSEVRKWDVGVRIGRAIKHYKTSSAAGSSRKGSHASPRPHMRRGHWHHYWTGPKSGERKLVLKWTAPTFVSASLDEQPVVIHRITKSDQER